MHNYLRPDAQWHFPELATEGVLAHVFQNGTRVPHLDAADVGRIAASALSDPARFSGLELELGYQNLTPEDAAEMLTRVSGFPVKTRVRSAQEVAENRSRLPAVPFQEMAQSIAERAGSEEYPAQALQSYFLYTPTVR